MRYFDEKLVANSTAHQGWWAESCAIRQHFHEQEELRANAMRTILNSSGLTVNAGVLPQDMWKEIDTITRRIVRLSEGTGLMADLMPLAKSVSIGKLVHISRVSSDISDEVQISMSGQPAVPVDKVDYNNRGTPVPIFQKGYGREWREWNTLQASNFDALADDQEAAVSKIVKAQAKYVLDGNAKINVGGYVGYGIKNHPLVKSINLGTAAGGANIDLTAADGDDVDNFLSGPFGAMLDGQGIAVGVNFVVSPEIGRQWDKSYSGASGFKGGRIIDFILTSRRVNKVTVDFSLSGNEFVAYVPSEEYIRPLVGLAITTTPVARLNPTDNYQFQVMGAMGIDIRGDFAGKSGVFKSVVIN